MDVEINRARKIHSQICRIASVGSVRVGFANSSAASEAIADLKRFGLRKPLFANGRAWVRRLVVEDQEAYVCLSPNIRLEFIYDGRLAYWNGYGRSIDYKALHDFAQKAGPWVLREVCPVWVCINFGLDYQPFFGLLDGLTDQD